MLRLILMIFFFLLSLLCVFRAPTNWLWYLSILITEFSWIFFCVVCTLLFWRFGSSRYNVLAAVFGILSLLLYALPIIGAYRISSEIDKRLSSAFSRGSEASVETLNSAAKNVSNQSPNIHQQPFSLQRPITGINAKQIAYKTVTYDKANNLTLDFYSAVKVGKGYEFLHTKAKIYFPAIRQNH